MHEGQVELLPDAVADLVAAQVPELAGLPIARQRSAGTVIAPFRIGQAFLARVPLVPDASDATRERLAAEAAHARALTGRVGIEVPRPIALGEPAASYPGYWSVWTWLPGHSLDVRPVDPMPLATDLARVLQAVAAASPSPQAGWTGGGRGGVPLADTDQVRVAIERSAHLVDGAAATRAWERALAAPPLVAPPSPIHGDPMPGNFLARDDRLAAMIDIAAPVVGDPAADLQPAWVFFEGADRERFLDAMGADEAARERGRGWAFEMAITGLGYYERSNPTFSAMAARTLDRLLADG